MYGPIATKIILYNILLTEKVKSYEASKSQYCIMPLVSKSGKVSI